MAELPGGVTVYHDSDPAQQSEDCLRLNVSTPDVAGKRPVVVWFHGGAYRIGSGNLDTHAFAQQADCVVVSVVHRLNIFGYLRLGDAFGDDFAASHNVGMLDLAAALRWVQDNIAAFGGDASNVTLAGISGGGNKVVHAMAMPVFQGLFHKAIVMSPHDLWKRNDLASAERASEMVLKELGVAPGDIERLRQLPAAELIKAYKRVDSKLSPDPRWGTQVWLHLDLLAPSIDGRWLPDYPLDAIAGGASATIPLLAGTLIFDHFGMSPDIADFGWFGSVELERYLHPLYGDKTKAVIQDYADEHSGASPSVLLARIVTDADWRIPTIRLCEAKLRAGGPLPYLYEYVIHGTSGVYLVSPDASTSSLGRAGSSIDPTDAVATQQLRAFANFIDSGYPDSDGAISWSPYDLASRKTLHFDYECKIVSDPRGADRETWARLALR
jgi:para-nitrobenzyl esterase